jgi:hypothetical protein
LNGAAARPDTARFRDVPTGRARRSREGTTLRLLMEIGDDVLYHGRILRLLGHEPMSVPDRRAQVEDPRTGERVDVPYDELEPGAPEARGFDVEA